MSSEEKKSPELKVEVTYGDLKASFSGDTDTVLHSVNSFISREVPTFGIARALYLSFSGLELAEKFKDFVRITPEGPRVWSSGRRLSDKEVVALQLAAQIIGHNAGKSSSSWIELGNLQQATALKPKTLSSRLSELLKAGLVSKESGESGHAFRLTTQGVSWLSDVLGKKSV